MNGESRSQPTCSSNCRDSQKTRATVTATVPISFEEISMKYYEIPSFFSVNSHPFLPFLRSAEDWVTSITASDQAVSQSLDLQGDFSDFKWFQWERSGYQFQWVMRYHCYGKSILEMGSSNSKMNRMVGNVWDIKGYVVFINWTIYVWYKYWNIYGIQKYFMGLVVINITLIMGCSGICNLTNYCMKLDQIGL